MFKLPSTIRHLSGSDFSPYREQWPNSVLRQSNICRNGNVASGSSEVGNIIDRRKDQGIGSKQSEKINYVHFVPTSLSRPCFPPLPVWARVISGQNGRNSPRPFDSETLMHSCDRCQFFEPKSNGKARPSIRGDGECRRHPPVDNKAGPDQAVFPIVACDWWCGEYKRIT